jgi:hypothetical protein
MVRCAEGEGNRLSCKKAMTQFPIDNRLQRAEAAAMRTIALIALAAVTLTGCEQARQAQWQKAYNEKRATALQNGWTPAQAPRYMAPKPQFRQDAPPMIAGGGPTMIPVPVIMEPAPAPAPVQSRAPQPIIFMGGGSGTTIASQVGNSTVVSQFGGVNRGTTIATPVGNSTIVTQYGGVNRGTTIATQVGNSTIVSQIGGYRPSIGGYGQTMYEPPASTVGFIGY